MVIRQQPTEATIKALYDTLNRIFKERDECFWKGEKDEANAD